MADNHTFVSAQMTSLLAIWHVTTLYLCAGDHTFECVEGDLHKKMVGTVFLAMSKNLVAIHIFI